MSKAFSLQAVLKLRQHKEEAEERALAALGVQRQQTEATLERVRHELRQWTDARIGEIGRIGTGHTHHGSYARHALLQDAQQQLELQLTILETRRREQQVVYLAARSAKEMLSTLKSEQLTAQQRSDARREQQRVEDLFLGRWPR